MLISSPVSRAVAGRPAAFSPGPSLNSPGQMLQQAESSTTAATSGGKSALGRPCLSFASGSDLPCCTASSSLKSYKQVSFVTPSMPEHNKTGV